MGFNSGYSGATPFPSRTFTLVRQEAETACYSDNSFNFPPISGSGRSRNAHPGESNFLISSTSPSTKLVAQLIPVQIAIRPDRLLPTRLKKRHHPALLRRFTDDFWPFGGGEGISCVPANWQELRRALAGGHFFC